MIILDSFLDRVFAQNFPARHDGSPAFRYFPLSSYGVSSKPFSFLSGKNTLRGARYFVGNKPKAVLVFFHGALGGHTAYSSLIARFAKQGYLVYAYDYTGCMWSQGRDCNGMGQPLLDQKAFFEFLRHDKDAQGLPVYACGHSWGGFCALACLQEDYPVSKVINLAGFNSVFDLAASRMDSKAVASIVRGYLKRKYGPIGAYDGLEQMKKTDREVLCVSGDKDDVVNAKHFFYRYKKEVNNPHVHFLEVKGRGHQCYWLEKSQEYYLDIAGRQRLRSLDAEPSLFMDYKKLIEDEKVMKALFDFLEG